MVINAFQRENIYSAKVLYEYFIYVELPMQKPPDIVMAMSNRLTISVRMNIFSFFMNSIGLT